MNEFAQQPLIGADQYSMRGACCLDDQRIIRPPRPCHDQFDGANGEQHNNQHKQADRSDVQDVSVAPTARQFVSKVSDGHPAADDAV